MECALELCRQTKHAERAIVVWEGMALVQRVLRDYPAAFKQLDQALTVAQKNGFRRQEAYLWGNLGLLYQETNALEEARRAHERSLELKRDLQDLIGQAASYSNLGVLAKARGDLAQAESYHRRSLELNRQVGHRDGEITDLGNLGVVLRDRGLLQDALQAQNHAIASADQFGFTDSMWRIRLGRAETHRRAGNLDAVERDWRDAIEVIEQLRGRLGLESQRLSFFGEDKTSVYARLILFLVREKIDLPRAIETIERAKTRVMNEQLATTDIHAPQHLPAELVAREREQVAELRALATAPQLSPEGVARWHSISNRLTSLWDEMASLAPEYVGLRRGKPLGYAALREILTWRVEQNGAR
jgi:tetratricopeptide (TPR) repeat protein